MVKPPLGCWSFLPVRGTLGLPLYLELTVWLPEPGKFISDQTTAGTARAVGQGLITAMPLSR